MEVVKHNIEKSITQSEIKNPIPDIVYKPLEKLAEKVDGMFSDDSEKESNGDAEMKDEESGSEKSEEKESKDKDAKEKNEISEIKLPIPDIVYDSLEKLAEKVEELFTDDFPEESEKRDEKETSEGKEKSKNDNTEKIEDETRELTDAEKQELKDKTGWPDRIINKCTIDENGIYHLKTDCSYLEGKTAENGVPYVRRIVEINGVKIEGVFPKFNSAFDTKLNPDNYKSRAYAKECNANLKEAVKNNPELRSKFTEEQLKDIEEGRTPTGYVWHHNEEPGKMQLVKREDHDRTIGGAAHTGGNSLWGADSVDNSKKGENF